MQFGPSTTVSASAGAVTVPTGSQHITIDPGEGGAITVNQINFQTTPNNGDGLLVRNANSTPSVTLAAGGNLRLTSSVVLASPYDAVAFVYLGGQLTPL